MLLHPAAHLRHCPEPQLQPAACVGSHQTTQQAGIRIVSICLIFAAWSLMFYTWSETRADFVGTQGARRAAPAV